MKKQFIFALAIFTFMLSACDRNDDVLPIGNPEPIITLANSEFIKPISITSIYPETAKSGTEVAILGENFGQTIPENYVTINGWKAEILSVPHNGLVLVHVPLLAPGEYAISLHANGQTTTSTTALTILDNK